jgi:hypothetical protein
MDETLNWDIYTIAQQHHEAMLLEREKNQGIRHALTHSGKYRDLYDRAIAWLGRRLIVWGGRLQERHEAAAPALQTANRTR